MEKRIISIILVLSFVLSVFPSFGNLAFAASTDRSGTSHATIAVDQTWSNPGKSVDIDLVITENPGILGATLVVSWDDGLTLSADASGDAFDHMTYQAPSRYSAEGTNFLWYGTEIYEKKLGTILTLTFSVSDDVENDDILAVNVGYTLGDVVDEDDNDVVIDITNGYVRAINYLPGDVTGDGRVNSRDLVRLSQFISDGCTNDADGYNANVVENACDVNGDGRINARDLIKLSQYVSDGSKTDPNGFNAVLMPAQLPECNHSDLTKTPQKAATCTEDGNIDYWQCQKCKKRFSDANAADEITMTESLIPAKGHTEVTDKAVPPSCTETGLTEGKHCSVCNAVLVAQTEVPVVDHTPGNAATCTKDQTCTICGKVLKSANGHIPGVKATCTEPQRCTVCKEILTNATGHHLNYIEEREPKDEKDLGNRAYWQCSVCKKCYSDESSTHEISVADTVWKTYLVYFFDLENDTHTIRAYKQSEVLSLKNIAPAEMKGYDFNGWHTSENFTNDNKVSFIPAGTTGIVNLFANRSLHEYKITKLGLGREESDSYTVDKGYKLTTPKWKESAGSGDCLIFSHWSDENGDKITEISAGTIGDRTIEANWIYKENYAVSNKNKYTYVNGVIDQYGRYSFIYEIGVIKDLVLSRQHSYTFDGLTEHTEAETKTYTVGASSGKAVAKTISSVVSSSSEMANISKHTTSHTAGWEIGAKWRPEVEFEGIKVSAWEVSGGYSKTDTDVYEETGFSSENNYNENGTEDEVRATIDYYSEESASRTVSETFIPGVTPVGNYTWARLMDVKVYAIVTYNPYTGNYVFDTYSVPTNVHDGLLYTLPTDLEYDINIVSGDVLDFEIPFDEIPEMFYTVEYNANGGTGEIYKSVHELGVSSTLFENKFTKNGYTFIGWNTSPDGNGTTYTDKYRIDKDLTVAGETITLYAMWEPIPYTVQWNSSTGYSISVERTASPNVGAFTGSIASGDTVYYGDVLKITYTNNIGYSITTHGMETIEVMGDISSSMIYATATINTYTIEYNANGGSGTTDPSYHTYGQSNNLSKNGFTRHGWTFIGWSTDPSATIATYSDGQYVINMTTEANTTITLYAVWKIETQKSYLLLDERYFDIGCVNKSFAFAEKLGDYFNISDLINAGYSKIDVTFTYNIRVDGDHFKTDSKGWYGYMMSDGVINNIDRMFYESDTVKMDHNAYASFSYSGSTDIINLTNGSDYVGISIWIHPWGGLDFSNKGTISDVKVNVNFV